MFLLNNDMLNDYYFIILESSIRKWLTSSIGVSAFAKSRTDFANGLTLKILDEFPIIENGSIEHSKNTISFSYGTIVYNISVKTITTHFEYPQCLKLSQEQNEICHINIIKSIEEIIGFYSKEDKVISKKDFFVLVVYPCTHNDKEWEPYFEKIKPFFKSLTHLHDFRFINNIPGCIYIGEIHKRNEDLDKLLPTSSLSLPSNLSPIEILNVGNDILKFKVDRQHIVEEIREEMLQNDSTYSFEELQDIFENKYITELKLKYPNITSEEINSVIKKFRSNGSGAKRAHLLLTTVNEKHRVHYRPNIKNNYSLYNLFYYINEDSSSRRKLVKAFKLGDTRISDNIKVYYEKANSKNEEPNYETLGKIRNESNF
jgi:hypothetical protein